MAERQSSYSHPGALPESFEQLQESAMFEACRWHDEEVGFVFENHIHVVKVATL